MKKFWKYALGATALASLIPFSHKKDKETGASVTQALLWSYSKNPKGDKKFIFGLHLGSMPVPNGEDVVDVEEPVINDELMDCEIVPVEEVEIPEEIL